MSVELGGGSGSIGRDHGSLEVGIRCRWSYCLFTGGGGSGSIGGRLLNPHPNPYSPRHAFTQAVICVFVSSGIWLSGRWIILFLHESKLYPLMNHLLL